MFKFCSSLVFVIACVACGSKFTANEGGALASGGDVGDANGGQTSSIGGDAGDVGVGGTSAGGTSAGGTGGGTDSGGTGASAGMDTAKAGSAGSDTGSECAKLKQQFSALLEKARACNEAATDECSPSSTLEPLGCGCPVLVNAKSEYTTAAKKARQTYRDAKCVDNAICPAIACVQPTAASCVPGTAADSFVCTGITAVN